MDCSGLPYSDTPILTYCLHATHIIVLLNTIEHIIQFIIAMFIRLYVLYSNFINVTAQPGALDDEDLAERGQKYVKQLAEQLMNVNNNNNNQTTSNACMYTLCMYIYTST